MAYPEFKPEGVISKYNEAWLQMNRLNTLQDRIHNANLNPLIFFPDENLYGYQIVFHSLNSLFAEASSKLSDPELDEGKNKRKEIMDAIKQASPHKLCENALNHRRFILFSKEKWESLREKLFEYELFVRKLMEKHKLTSPEEDESDMF